MSLDLEDKLILSLDEDYVEEVAKYPVATSDPELVGEADTIPPEPTGAEPSEKAKRTKAYKLVAPVGALFGRLAKRKLDALAASAGDAELDAPDSPRRPEALLLKGVPISRLSTEKIFEYCAYYSSTSITQLEWVDDQSCVLVYEDPTMAASAYNAIRRPAESEPADDLEMALCHPLPISLWPAAERLAASLGNQSQGLKGPISMRWALKSDVKARNARQQSKYYEKHGGAPLSSGRKRGRDEGENDVRGSLRRRLDDPPDPAAERARELAALDADLDRFAAGESSVDENGTKVPAPLLGGEERLSAAGSGRRIAPLPGRRKGGRRMASKSVPRPVVDKDTLDAELDAFLEGKD